MSDEVKLTIPKSVKQTRDAELKRLAEPVYYAIKKSEGPVSATTLALDCGLTVSDVYRSVEWMRGKGVRITYTVRGFRLGD